MQATPRSRATAGRGPASRSAAPTTASVRLARELAHYWAPAALVAHARDAALGERRQRARHAPPRREVRGRRRRLQAAHADVLVENAVEGCVRGTFGALMAHVQARRAPRRTRVGNRSLVTARATPDRRGAPRRRARSRRRDRARSARGRRVGARAGGARPRPARSRLTSRPAGGQRPPHLWGD